jgi:hypothetical protein
MPDPTDIQETSEPEDINELDAFIGAPLDPDYLEHLTKEVD